MKEERPMSYTTPGAERDQWLTARLALLEKEKAFIRERDELARLRRELPRVPVGTGYVFEGPSGPVSLADLFEGRSQLIVYHFMFAPEWERGCKSCSFWADHFDTAMRHLKARDTTLVAISRAPLQKLRRQAERLDWHFPWYSSGSNGFGEDFDVSFTSDMLEGGEGTYNYAPRQHKMSDLPGVSVFLKDEAGQVFHTYSTYSRGIDILNGTYNLLDLTPKGRDEGALPSPMA